MIVDLEDAVAPERKAAARESAARLLSAGKGGSSALLRINGAETPFFAADLELLGAAPVDGVVLPKATPEAVDRLADLGLPVVALVESARGLQLSAETAQRPGVIALALGGADLGSELGLSPLPDEAELAFARAKLVLDASAAGLRAPIDVVHLDVRDLTGLRASAARARALGLRGKLCIHPDQVAVVNEAFTPGEAEVAWATRVVEAYEQRLADGEGVFALDGQMIDAAVAKRARRVLADAERSDA